jgi:hypothetical protein
LIARCGTFVPHPGEHLPYKRGRKSPLFIIQHERKREREREREEKEEKKGKKSGKNIGFIYWIYYVDKNITILETPYFQKTSEIIFQAN